MRTLTLVLVVTLVSILTGCGERRSKEGNPSASPSEGSGEKKAQASEASEDAKEPSGLIELSEAAQRRIGLTLVSATTAPLAEVLTLNGTVQPLEGRITSVRPLTRGRLKEVLVKVGDRVNSGQLLAQLDNIEAGDLSSQYNTARADLARLRIQQAVTARQAERSRKLVAIGAVPQKELEAIEGERQGQEEAIRAQESTIAGLVARLQRFGVGDPTSGTSTTTIEAPFAGVVTAVQAAQGAVVETTSELLSIVDLSQVYVAGQVYERDLSKIRIGQNVAVVAAGYPDVRFPGRVASLSPSLNPETRTASVRVEVANTAERLRIDMFATVELPMAANSEALTVRTDAIQRVEGKSVVFVRADATHFSARPVQVGRTASNLIEITSGLKAGELVVTKGSFNLKSALLGKELSEKE